MDHYVRTRQGVEMDVEEPTANLSAKEVRVSPHGQIKQYVAVAAGMFADDKDESLVVAITGRGKALSKAVSVAEILKRRVPGLHQHNMIGSSKIIDEWSPKPGEKLDKLEVVRYAPVIRIELSRTPFAADLPGYQPPERLDTVDTAASSASTAAEREVGPAGGPAAQGGAGPSSRGSKRQNKQRRVQQERDT